VIGEACPALDLNHFAEPQRRLAPVSTKMVRRTGMKIHFYGRLAESLGRDIEVEVPGGCSIADLRQRLATEYPHAANSLGHRARALVGDVVVADSHFVRPGDSVEFFPPVSGG
jgi:MoaE-MoaD fusion protein